MKNNRPNTEPVIHPNFPRRGSAFQKLRGDSVRIGHRGQSDRGRQNAGKHASVDHVHSPEPIRYAQQIGFAFLRRLPHGKRTAAVRAAARAAEGELWGQWIGAHESAETCQLFA